MHVVFTCTCRLSKLYREGGTEEEFEKTLSVYILLPKIMLLLTNTTKPLLPIPYALSIQSVTHRQSIFSFPFYITCTNSFVPFSSGSIPHRDNMRCPVAQKMYQGVR